MGMDANATLFWGWAVEEGQVEEIIGEDELITWWRNLKGYEPLFDEIWDENGEYLPGITEDSWKEEYYNKAAWDEKCPCPIREVFGYDGIVGIEVVGYSQSVSWGPERILPPSPPSKSRAIDAYMAVAELLGKDPCGIGIPTLYLSARYS